MQVFRAVWGLALLVSSACPAFADIAAFNAAISNGDYKAAAVEASATWPTLDKSREDIAVIAREFGFASLVSGDHAAAKGFAQFAAEKEAGANDEPAATTAVLLRLSEHKLAPNAETRRRLVEAVTARGAFPGLNVITFMGVDTLIAYDFEKGRWKDAQASGELGVKLTESAGPGYVIQHRYAQLLTAVADYRATQKAAVYHQFRDLQKTVANDIEAAPSEEAAQRYVPLYWQIGAWRETVSAHLTSRRLPAGTKKDEAEDKEERKRRNPDGNFSRVIHRLHDDDTCERSLSERKKPKYPSSALHAGYVGSVLVQVDIDESGKISNPQILAAVPEKYFGEAVLESVVNMRYSAGKTWDPAACSLAEKGHIITFRFAIG